MAAFVKAAADEVAAGADVADVLHRVFLESQGLFHDLLLQGFKAWCDGQPTCGKCGKFVRTADDGVVACSTCGVQRG